MVSASIVITEIFVYFIFALITKSGGPAFYFVPAKWHSSNIESESKKKGDVVCIG